MTADIELLPMPSPQVPFIDCDPSMSDIRRLVRWYEQGATEHARANVAHAVATLQAEVEALRAEVERLKSMTAVTLGVGSGDGNLFVHGDYDSIKAAQSLVFRAERLAELLDQAYGYVPAGALADQIHCALLRFALTIADATLSKENRND